MLAQWRDRRGLALSMAALLLLTAAAYAPVVTYGVILYDDAEYFAENEDVRQGLQPSTFTWALASLEHANWHPLTWMSHALDWQLFGDWWGGHHASSLALHLATVVAVFLALWRLTRAPWRSLAVAAIFAVHPINVQSVAWISERKNVLSGLLFALTLAAYAAYARRPTTVRYVLVTVLFGLGLMAKPMLVTLPFVLLLLDAWPLARLRERTWHAVLEKVPWLAMAAADSVMTMRAQKAALALYDSSTASSLCAALGGYLVGLEKILWPAGLAIFYPKPSDPCWALPVGLAAGTLVAVTLGAVAAARRHPYVLVGWLWYVGMMVPVSGLVQAGQQLTADRYAYLPMLGLLIAVVWTLADLSAVSVSARRASALLVAMLSAVLAWRTSVEVRHWRDSVALFSRAIEVTRDNCLAYNNLSVELKRRGDRARAWQYATMAVERCPSVDAAQSNVATLLLEAGSFATAMPHLAAAARVAPANADAQYNLGLALWYQGRSAESLPWFHRALRADPRHEPAWAMVRRILADPARSTPRVK